jgi:PRTRC genetic system protein E
MALFYPYCSIMSSVDEARKLIPPVNLKGTAEELDNGFFETVGTPLQTASGLMVNMESFMKQMEEAKKKSAMEKEKSDKEKKKRKQRIKNLLNPYKRQCNLKKEGKYKDAWSRST